VTTTYWVPTIGNTLPPLPAGSGGTGSANGGPFWIPPDDGFTGYNSDPGTASGGGLLVATNAYLARLPIRVATTINNLWICMSSAGVGTSVTSFLWIVSGVNGAVLAQSTAAAAQAAMTGAGWQPVAMQAPVTIQPGTFPYAVILPNLLTTQPTLLRQNNSQNAEPQTPASPASLRWAQQAGFGSAVGAVTLASNAATAFTNIVGWN
jgi:hypothetical protein